MDFFFKILIRYFILIGYLVEVKLLNKFIFMFSYYYHAMTNNLDLVVDATFKVVQIIRFF